MLANASWMRSMCSSACSLSSARSSYPMRSTISLSNVLSFERFSLRPSFHVVSLSQSIGVVFNMGWFGCVSRTVLVWLAQNLRGLRRLFDEVESHIHSLKALGIDAESYGAMLAPVLVIKLPPDVRLIISRKGSSASPDVDNILKAVKEELMAMQLRLIVIMRTFEQLPPHFLMARSIHPIRLVATVINFRQ